MPLSQKEQDDLQLVTTLSQKKFAKLKRNDFEKIKECVGFYEAQFEDFMGNNKKSMQSVLLNASPAEQEFYILVFSMIGFFSGYGFAHALGFNSSTFDSSMLSLFDVVVLLPVAIAAYIFYLAGFCVTGHLMRSKQIGNHVLKSFFDLSDNFNNFIPNGASQPLRWYNLMAVFVLPVLMLIMISVMYGFEELSNYTEKSHRLRQQIMFMGLFVAFPLFFFEIFNKLGFDRTFDFYYGKVEVLRWLKRENGDVCFFKTPLEFIMFMKWMPRNGCANENMKILYEIKDEYILQFANNPQASFLLRDDNEEPVFDFHNMLKDIIDEHLPKAKNRFNTFPLDIVEIIKSYLPLKKSSPYFSFFSQAENEQESEQEQAVVLRSEAVSETNEPTGYHIKMA